MNTIEGADDNGFPEGRKGRFRFRGNTKHPNAVHQRYGADDRGWISLAGYEKP